MPMVKARILGVGITSINSSLNGSFGMSVGSDKEQPRLDGVTGVLGG